MRMQRYQSKTTLHCLSEGSHEFNTIEIQIASRYVPRRLIYWRSTDYLWSIDCRQAVRFFPKKSCGAKLSFLSQHHERASLHQDRLGWSWDSASEASRSRYLPVTRHVLVRFENLLDPAQGAALQTDIPLPVCEHLSFAHGCACPKNRD